MKDEKKTVGRDAPEPKRSGRSRKTSASGSGDLRTENPPASAVGSVNGRRCGMKRNDKPTWLMLLRDIAEVAVSIALFGLLLWAFLWVLVNGFKEIGDALKLRADTVSEDCGVGRATASLNGVLLLGGETGEPEGDTALRVYTEGVDSPMPEWWDPDELMAIEWYVEDHFVETAEMVDNDHFAETGNMVEAEPHPPVGVSPGGVDWNIETDIHGWNGHTMTGVELDLFSRVFMLEFWGTSIECCEAGADAILNLWDSGLYGRTMGDCLWAKNDSGKYIYSVCNYLWDWDYDPEGLEWCREFCLERFIEGPNHETMYFQLGGFHDTSWTIPLFECDGVYFSKGK